MRALSARILNICSVVTLAQITALALTRVLIDYSLSGISSVVLHASLSSNRAGQLAHRGALVSFPDPTGCI